MTLLHLSEIVWQFYQQGRPSADSQTFGEADILQFLKLSLSNVLRKAYYDSKRLDEYGEPDYALIANFLSIKRFDLGEASADGTRLIDISSEEFFRFPKNAQLSNVYPVNNKCGGQKLKPSTLVAPGEHYYFRAAKFEKYLHHEQSNKFIKTYNFPPCVEKVDVESTFTSEEINVILDVAYDAAVFVLNMTLGIKDKYDPVMLRKQLEKEAALK